MNTRQHLSSQLRRFSHLQPFEIDAALRRIFDWGEPQNIVLSELGLSSDQQRQLMLTPYKLKSQDNLSQIVLRLYCQTFENILAQ